MMRLIAFLAAILLATSADAASTTSKNVDITVTHAGGPVQTLIPMIQKPGTAFQFLAGTGSANRAVGNIMPAAIFPPFPAFAGTWSITGGTDAGKFKINSTTGVVSACNTAPSCTDLAAGTYSIVVTLTQAGIIDSPASTAVTLQGVDVSDTTTAFVALDNYNPAPGSTITVTVRNAPNTSGFDYAQISGTYGRVYANSEGTSYKQRIGAAGTHNATLTLLAPAPPNDNYQFLNVFVVRDDLGQSQAKVLTPDILVQPHSAPVIPTPPNTLTPPFTPNLTITVCASGCNYNKLSSAIIGLSNANIGTSITENILITMQAGTYGDCIQFGNWSPFAGPTADKLWHLPQHLWIKGIGGSFPRLEAVNSSPLTCGGKGVIVFWGATGTDILYLDNLEIADWAVEAPSGGVYAATGSITMRNMYIHDGEMCIISGASPQQFVLQNVHFARCGGFNGPSHDAYIGDGAATLDVNHSLIEQAMNGHEFKTRAWISHFSCNQLIGSQDPYYVDSEEIDCSEGRECQIDNNTIVKGVGSTQQNQIGWSLDIEAGYPPMPPHIWSITENNNIIISDDPNSYHWFTYLGPSCYLQNGPNLMTSPPNVWNNNIFVGGLPGGTYPYLSCMLPGSGYPNPAQITEVGTQQYTTRAAWIAAGGSSAHIPYPPGCSGTIGNVAVP